MSEPPNRPNILVIWGDDVGMWNISAYHRGGQFGKNHNGDRDEHLPTMHGVGHSVLRVAQLHPDALPHQPVAGVRRQERVRRLRRRHDGDG